MKINHKVIPQVIPHQQYTDHLNGASDSGEETVRLFASLSLARMHPNVTTWAAAAEALGMPGPMGTRCARACARSLLISADEWQARIWTAIQDVDRRDYQAPPKPRSSTAST